MTLLQNIRSVWFPPFSKGGDSFVMVVYECHMFCFNRATATAACPRLIPPSLVGTCFVCIHREALSLEQTHSHGKQQAVLPTAAA